MKVLLLSPANNIHTIRWANGLSMRGLQVKVCSIHPLDNDNESFSKAVSLHILKSKPPTGYFLVVSDLRNIIKSYKPDIINAHYATGYGTLARITVCYPYLLSVWGSDVYDFPKKSKLHRWFLAKNLKAATAIASTSRCMVNEVEKTLSPAHVFITPFGIDHQHFSPSNTNVSQKKCISSETETIIIGTVKTLEPKYGIDLLIQAFAQVKDRLDDISIKLQIMGRGFQLDSLQKLARSLNVQDCVEFKGFIPHTDLPYHINQLDIYVALSHEESFGVAILEASACGRPVLVSDADGLKEVVKEGVTGFIVPKNNLDAAADKMMVLIQNPSIREAFGKAGRQHVIAEYTWEKSLDIMIQTYKKTCQIYDHQ